MKQLCDALFVFALICFALMLTLIFLFPEVIVGQGGFYLVPGVDGGLIPIPNGK